MNTFFFQKRNAKYEIAMLFNSEMETLPSRLFT